MSSTSHHQNVSLVPMKENQSLVPPFIKGTSPRSLADQIIDSAQYKMKSGHDSSTLSRPKHSSRVHGSNPPQTYRNSSITQTAHHSEVIKESIGTATRVADSR